MEMETVGDVGLGLHEPPKYGMKLPLDHVFPLQSKQLLMPRPSQAFEMMPLTARYFYNIYLSLEHYSSEIFT